MGKPRHLEGLVRMPRRTDKDQSDKNSSGSPAQEDESDILAEVGAERDETTGDLIVDEEAIRKVGAVDAASVVENRRLGKIVGRKRAQEKNVTFNAGDLLTQYETLIKFWPPNTLDIGIKRLTGTPVQQVIQSRPRSGADLYEAIKAIHGQHGEAEYEVKILDSSRREFRANGRITMPDTRTVQQQGQPMQQPYYPNGAPVPQGYPQQQYAPQSAPQPQQPQASQPPQVFVQPAVAPAVDPMLMMHEMFKIFEQMRASVQQPVPQYQPPPPPPTQMPQMSPPPPPQASLGEQIAWMQESMRLFQQMQQSVQQPAQVQPQYAPPPVVVQQPAPPQNNLAEAMTMMESMFKMFQRMQPPPASEDRSYRDRGGPSRPPYYPQEDRGRGGQPPYSSHQPPAQYAPPPPPARPQSIADQFRESLTIIRTAASAMQEMNSLLPERSEAPVYESPQVVEDDSPVQVIDTGPAKIVVNKKDGTLRGMETAWANMDKVLKWAGEQREAIQKNARQQQQPQQPPQQQLPPGYVEVHPGYRPPPGYVAVPVDPRQEPLPPPPEYIPPPIQQQEEPAPTHTWSAPTIPDQGER